MDNNVTITANVIEGSPLSADVTSGAVIQTTVIQGNPVVGNVVTGAPGATGPQGPAGTNGEGVPVGGSTGEVLKKTSGTDYDTEWGNLDADDIDDTSTTNKFTDAADIAKLAGIEAGADVTDAANVGSSIHGATAKTTPVDADTMPLIDSAASNVLKKVTWANIKATFKTYLDTLYQPLNSILTNTTASFTTADETKLDGIEAGADVTDATNVNAAGATMNSDTSLAGNGYFLDEDNMASNDPTKVPSQQSVKAYVDAQDTGTVDSIGAGQNIDVDATDPANPIVSVENLVVADITDLTASATELNVLDGIPVGLTATELGYVDGVTSAIQTQIDTKVTGPASATDNAVARFNLTTGKLIQNSGVTIDDSNVITAAGMIVDGTTSGRFLSGNIFGYAGAAIYNASADTQVAFAFLPSGLMGALGYPNAGMVGGAGGASSFDTAMVRSAAAEWTIYGSNGTILGNIVTSLIRKNAGTPESAVTAPVGAICHDTTNGDLYVKESGTGNTGWVKLVKATSGITTVDAGDDLSTSRPTGVGVVYWVFDDPTVDAGTSGENIVNGQDGDLWYVPDA